MTKVIPMLSCISLLLGCSGSNPDPGDPTTEMGLLENQSISVASDTRSFHLYLPTDPGSAAIVLLLHGNGGSSDQVLGLNGTKAPHKVWMDVALRENIILVAPDGSIGSNDNQGWNDCRADTPTNPTSDDVLFINTLLEQVKSTYSTETPRVFAVGTSNGGHMVMRLSDETPGAFNAVATIVAAKPVNTQCSESSDPLPMLIMNGTNDPLVPYEGGQVASDRGEVLSTAEMVSYWINRNQTTSIPIETSIPDIDQTDDSRIQRFSYTNSSGSAVLEHYEVINGGHTEPSLLERYSNIFKLIVGNQNGDLEMAEEVWDFFKLH